MSRQILQQSIMSKASLSLSRKITDELEPPPPPPPPPPSPMLVPKFIDFGELKQALLPCQAIRFMKKLYEDEEDVPKWKYRLTENDTTLMVWSKSGYWHRDCRSLLDNDLCDYSALVMQRVSDLQVVELAKL
ncbi:uncharacterized protein PV09_09663 [Verruconis gallopava]|uniref:Uncharacterized protein n=1 Tax=Verruconis gallopava TaxID=253628 RepID=A0A0D1X910_9PEZI|nr:uncharacterized protein PV09_09663 [Verruconis gallopava]KIV98525.1 hypothetical protein PV09_09663 [Verruconis gallopava]